MKKFLPGFGLILLALLVSPELSSARQGCCSSHGGVCGCSCCDGTSLSATCRPYYPECNRTREKSKIEQIIDEKKQWTGFCHDTIGEDSYYDLEEGCLCKDGFELGLSGFCEKVQVFESEYVPIVEVVDGDTVKVKRSLKTETIRIIGIDTPETKDPRYPVQCFGKEATNKAKELLDGKRVILETKEERDKYGRLLAYIRVDREDFGENMIGGGFAFHYRQYPHDRMEAYDKAENFARENDRGLWRQDTCNGQKTAEIEIQEEVETVEPEQEEEQVSEDFFDDFIEAQELSEPAKETLKKVVREEEPPQEEKTSNSVWREIWGWVINLLK